MSNETDLDWLARNVHVWPSGDHQPWCYVYMAHGGVMKAAGNFLDAVSKPTMITIDQWLARRAELQNKPAKWPIGANWLAQDKDGEWWFYTDEIDNPPQNHGEDNWYSDDVAVRCRLIGEVIGDWRDTLEKRPEQDEFETFASIEDSKEQETKQDNEWFERGELPPVGKVCLYVVSDRLSAEVEITAHAKFGLCFVEVGKSGENYVSKTAELHRFRPIPTERDVLLSIIVEEMNRYDTDGKLADAILAAGFKRGAA